MVLADVIKDLEMGKWRLSWITWWILNIVISVLIRERWKVDICKTGTGNVIIETKSGVMQPPAKECWQSTEAGGE